MASEVYAAAFFDYDGVIVDSARLKAQAFVDCLPDEPAPARSAILEYCTQHGGVSRFAKFRHIYAHILGRPLSEDTLDALCRRYSAIVVEQVQQAPFIAGAVELLRAIHAATDCYVVSGTPEVEVRGSVIRRGLAAFFKDVLGSPTPKSELTAGLVRRCGVPADRIVFLGDSITDYEAARDAGIAFLGVAPPHDRGSLPAHVDVADHLMFYRSRFTA